MKQSHVAPDGLELVTQGYPLLDPPAFKLSSARITVENCYAKIF